MFSIDNGDFLRWKELLTILSISLIFLAVIFYQEIIDKAKEKLKKMDKEGKKKRFPSPTDDGIF